MILAKTCLVENMKKELAFAEAFVKKRYCSIEQRRIRAG